MTGTEKMLVRREKVVLYMRANPNAGYKEVAKAMKVSVSTTARDLTELRRAGLIARRYRKSKDNVVQKILDLAKTEMEAEHDNEFYCRKYRCSLATIRRYRSILKTGLLIDVQNCTTKEEVAFREGQIRNKKACRRLHVLEGYEGVLLPQEMWDRYLEVRKFKTVGKKWAVENKRAAVSAG